MQLMPETARLRIIGTVYDPIENIEAEVQVASRPLSG